MSDDQSTKVRILNELKQDFRSVKTVERLHLHLDRAIDIVERIFGENSRSLDKFRSLVNAINFNDLEDYISITNTGKVTPLRIDGWDKYQAPLISALQSMIDELRLTKETSRGIMPRVFISYRRIDTSGHSGRVYDRLNQRFGANLTFFDVNSIQPGQDFVQVIENAVSSCEILLAVIGRQWLSITDEKGERRLDNPKDFVRLEIATALSRNIRVIPILVGGATMPQEADLPDDLKPLSRRNAIQINDETFHNDVDRLIAAIENSIDQRGRTEVSETRAIPMPAVPRKLSDKQKSDYLVQAFEVIKSYFQDGLAQLERNNQGIETSFREISNLKFICEIFLNGNSRTRCKIWVGAGMLSREMTIGYAEGHFDYNNDNSYNEMISVEVDNSSMYLHFSFGNVMPIPDFTPPSKPKAEDAAEMLWRRFISWI
jgi:hypothetical protein